MVAGLVATFVNNLYVALIGRYFNAAQVGYFTQATNLSNYLYQLITSTLMGVTYPILTSVKDENERLKNIYHKLISATLLVSMPIVIGFAAISEEFVLLFLGKDWEAATPILTALCFARAITPLSAINMNILNAVGRSDLFLKVDLVKLPITLPGLFLALPYGVQGVAWAMVCTSSIAFFINAYFPGKLFGFGAIYQLKVASKYIASTILMYLIVSRINIFDSLWLELVAKVFTGAVFYPLILLFLKDSFFISNCKLFWHMLSKKLCR
jgi:O-antigen/teichoic acid export membrane protein